MVSTHLYRPIYRDGMSLAHLLAAGRASALFAVLAGLSLALVTGRTAAVSGRERRARSVGLVVRSILLFAIGVGLHLLGTRVAVVLQTYSVLMVAMLPFLGWRPRNLAILAGTWVVAGPMLMIWILTWWPSWEVWGWGTVTEVTVGMYPLPIWITFFWVGLALGRMDLTRRSLAVWLTGIGTVMTVIPPQVSTWLVRRPGVIEQMAADVGTTDLAYLRFGLDMGMQGFIPSGTNWWLAIDSAHSGTPFELATTIGSALAVIGLCLLLARVAPRLVSVVSGAGAMSLTAYCLHVIGMHKSWWPREETGSFWIYVAAFLVGGAVFRAIGRRGPLEALVSTVSGWATRSTRARLRT